MFITQILRNSAAGATRHATRSSTRSYSAGSSWGVKETKRLSRTFLEGVVFYSSVLAWPFVIARYSEHGRYVSENAKYE